jgi:hypothetical protein
MMGSGKWPVWGRRKGRGGCGSGGLAGLLGQLGEMGQMANGPVKRKRKKK